MYINCLNLNYNCLISKKFKTNIYVFKIFVYIYILVNRLLTIITYINIVYDIIITIINPWHTQELIIIKIKFNLNYSTNIL